MGEREREREKSLFQNNYLQNELKNKREIYEKTL